MIHFNTSQRYTLQLSSCPLKVKKKRLMEQPVDTVSSLNTAEDIWCLELREIRVMYLNNRNNVIGGQ